LFRIKPSVTPDRCRLKYEDIVFLSRDGTVKLSGWFIPNPTSGKCIILAHGGWRHRADPGIGLLDLARCLNLCNYNVLMFDFRGHGKSGGSWQSIGPEEAGDILGAFDYLSEERHIRIENIGILGFSLGAVAVLLAAFQERRIRAIVSDSAFARYEWINMSLKDRLIATILFSGLKRVDPLDRIERIRAKMFFVNGEEDRTTLPCNAKELFKVSGGDCSGHQLWIVPEASHVQSFNSDPEEYVSRVIQFFDKKLGGSS